MSQVVWLILYEEQINLSFVQFAFLKRKHQENYSIEWMATDKFSTWSQSYLNITICISAGTSGHQSFAGVPAARHNRVKRLECPTRLSCLQRNMFLAVLPQISQVCHKGMYGCTTITKYYMYLVKNIWIWSSFSLLELVWICGKLRFSVWGDCGRLDRSKKFNKQVV